MTDPDQRHLMSVTTTPEGTILLGVVTTAGSPICTIIADRRTLMQGIDENAVALGPPDVAVPHVPIIYVTHGK